VYYEQQQFNEAINAYSEAIEHNPKLAFAYANRAETYNQIGKYDLAIADCDKALEIDPNLVIAYLARASADLPPIVIPLLTSLP